MIARTWGNLLIVVVLIVAVGGCGGSNTSTDTTDAELIFARNLIDALYTGSLSHLANSLDPVLLRGMPDRVTTGVSALLLEHFGEVGDLRLQSRRTVQQNWTETVWTVSAEHRSFEMKLTWNSEGRVSGIWLRPSSAQDWSPTTQIGVDYARREKHPPGW